jgi:hypothetical protein
MSSTEYNVLHVVHVLAAIVLAGFTHQAFAAPAPESRKRVLIWTGTASLLMLLTGVRMWQAIHGFAGLGWIVVKLLCWIGLAAMSGLAFRFRDRTRVLASVALLLTALAVAMVYLKPF